MPYFAIYEVQLMESEKTIFQPEAAPLHLTFLVFSGASIMCVASAIDRGATDPGEEAFGRAAMAIAK